MPMVFSATTLSMPALAASLPISSSILPRPQPVDYRVACLCIYLERLRSEIQAMTAHQGGFRLRSRGKCCSNARVDARFTPCCRSASSVFLPGVEEMVGKHGLRRRDAAMSADGFNRPAGCAMIGLLADRTFPRCAKRRCDGYLG